MKHGGHAVADGLPVAVKQRQVDREIDAGARHHLPLERVAMEVDDARQHDEPARVDRQRTVPAFGSDGIDVAARRPHRGVLEFLAEQGPAAFNEKIGHDVALRRLLWMDSLEAASYLSRKSSMASFLKSGSARRNASWSQSHHARSARRPAMFSGKRRLIGRAGLPATMV